jgi:hypothetical protein
MFQEPEANAAEIQAVTAAGAFIMGRNMFGPGRDDWDLVEGTKPLPTGKVTVGFDFDYDGGGLHKRATGTLFVNGTKVGEGRIDKTMSAVYSLAGETADVGMDAYSPVTDDYDPWDNALTGTITKVVVKLTADEGHHTQAQRHIFRN